VTVAARHHFARLAGNYRQLRERWPLAALRAEEQRALRELVAVRAGERALDVGCGDGVTLGWLRSRGAHCVGVDAVWRMAAVARRSGALTVVQDMEALGLRRCFDWVLCVGALEFTVEPRRAIRELSNCLRPGGKLGLLFPRRSPLGHLYAAYHLVHGLRVHLFSHQAIRAHLAAVDFEPVFPWRDCLLSTVCVAQRCGDGNRA
jgi:SAM-dependent methyltransferase